MEIIGAQSPLVGLPQLSVFVRPTGVGLEFGAEEADVQPAVHLLQHLDGPVGGEALAKVLILTGQQSFLVAGHRTEKAAIDSSTTIARVWPCPLGKQVDGHQLGDKCGDGAQESRWTVEVWMCQQS